MTRAWVVVAGLWASGPAFAADLASLAQITAAPERYKGEEVLVDATFQRVMSRDMDDDCKRKDKAILLALPAGPDGAVPPGGAVQYEACVSVENAVSIADKPSGAQVRVTGTVRIVKMMGSVYAIVIDKATLVPRAPSP
jgi:hypothetical protein